jgi:hypothetical protein
MKIKEVSSLVKCTIFIPIYLFCISVGLVQADNPEYMFDEFKTAFLISSNKQQYQAEVNYSFTHNEFVFKDISDNNQIKVIDPVMDIRTIKVDDRIFLIDEKGSTKEVLQHIPLIMVQYKGRMKPGGKNAGYGGESETSAIDSYSHFYSQSGGPPTELKTNKYKLMGVDKIYEIDRAGKLKSFISQSKFTKLYPKEVQKELDAYINESKIDFNDPEQVIELYNYAEELAKQ